jgi:AcrR family transcriptional regulator
MAGRKYKSALREAHARDTRRRILEAAGRITLLDLGRVTHAAVARIAEVSERTVYRHFPTVADLHDAFSDYQEQRFGGGYAEDLSLDDLPAVFEAWPQKFVDTGLIENLHEETDPPMVTKSRRNRYARLEEMLAELVPDASETQVRQLVLVIGQLMSPESFRRGVKIFDLDPADVVPGPSWAIRVLIEALRKGDTPWTRS